jgi:hypothetical protein
MYERGPLRHVGFAYRVELCGKGPPGGQSPLCIINIDGVHSTPPIVRFAINQREQPNDGVAPGRKARRRRHNGLIDLKAVIWHNDPLLVLAVRHELREAWGCHKV